MNIMLKQQKRTCCEYFLGGSIDSVQLGRQGTWANLVEQDAGSGGDGVSRAHALQVEEESLAEVLQGSRPCVEQLVVDHPRCEVASPVPLAEGKVQSTCECRVRH